MGNMMLRVSPECPRPQTRYPSKDDSREDRRRQQLAFAKERVVPIGDRRMPSVRQRILINPILRLLPLNPFHERRLKLDIDWAGE